MNENYPLALSRLRIGQVELKNRIARTAHATMLVQNGKVSDELIEYHAARARGGVGLTILEAAAVHPSSMVSLQCFDDTAIEGYLRLTRRVAPFGMRVFQQLWHGGHIFKAPDGSPPFAPSSVPSHVAGIAAQPLRRAEIRELIAGFAAAAARCEKGGLDGVEIHAGHGYLISQFLSPVLNQREDEYGGELEKRMRFLIEVLRAVRETVSPRFAVGVRVSNSSDPTVLSTADVALVARRLVHEGLIDYVNSSYGDYYANQHQVGGMEVGAGFQIPHTAPPVANLKIPRLLNGRFRSLEEIERTLQAGHADLISMVRAHIADPDIVAKTLAGHAHRVRPCLACNQGCVAQAATPGRIGCVVNAAVGEEAALSEDLIARAAEPQKVLIVGGGPAGLEAARVAALAGHRVVLAEASERLGGLLNLCRLAPNMAPINDLANWLASEVHRLGVDIRLSSSLDLEGVLALNPDRVLVAVGANAELQLRQVQRPGDRLKNHDAHRVLSSVELFTSGATPGKTALVVDEFGHYEAVACAEFLIERGLAVTFVTRHKMFAPSVDVALRTQSALERLYSKGSFTVLTGSYVESLDPRGAVVTPQFGRKAQLIEADTIVWIPVREGRHDLAAALAERGVSAVCIGDARAGRDIQMAIRDGHLAARAIGGTRNGST
jgi:2,4-dienoyl-CoA reductase-like NADH-dependent reductase (Old Yellow Enzyme family)